MLNDLSIILHFWTFAYMVFHVNPLNDKSNPRSHLHYYHPDNMAGRMALKKDLDASDIASGQVVLIWEDLWPYVAPTLTSLLAYTAMIIAR